VKIINLSKELLLNGMLIGVLSIGLVSCGGGGGGGSGPSTPTSPTGSGPSTPLSYSLATYLYSGTDYYNEPIITVYIDGQPVKLLADTGDSGLVVNSTAVNIPSSDYISYTSLGIPGVMASATVCLNPSITNSCVVMPITVAAPGPSFPPTGEAQGDFGLVSGSSKLDVGYTSSGSSITFFSYPTYLERQYGINSYTISFYPLSNTFYANVSPNTPIGYISFGVYNGNSNTLISYTMDPYTGQPETTVIFSSGTASFTDHQAVFDSGATYNILSTSVFQIEIPNFSQSADEGACDYYDDFTYNTVNSGLSITYSLQTNGGSFYSVTFTTEPSLSFCEADIPFTLMKGITLDAGPIPGGEIFGLSAMLGHTFTWVFGNNGLVKYIGISP